MGGKKKRKRSIGKIDRLPEHLRDTVNQMLPNCTYKQIVVFLKDNGHQLSQMSVHRYAEKYMASVEILRMSQENFRLLPKDKPMPMSIKDCAWLLTFAGDDVIPPSRISFDGDYPVVVDGPLKELELYIVKFNRRRRRVSLRIPILNERKDISLSIIPV